MELPSPTKALGLHPWIAKIDTLFITKMAANWFKSIAIYDQNGWKTITLGAAHTYVAHMRAHIREFPSFSTLIGLNSLNPSQYKG